MHRGYNKRRLRLQENVKKQMCDVIDEQLRAMRERNYEKVSIYTLEGLNEVELDKVKEFINSFWFDMVDID